MDNKKVPETHISGTFLRRQPGLADDYDVAGLGAFGAGVDVEFDFLAFVQVLEAITLDGGEVDENVRAAIASDEAEPFGSIEPFDCTCDTF